MDVFRAGITSMQNKWNNLLRSNVRMRVFPLRLNDILLADYPHLVSIYNTYNSVVGSLSYQTIDKIKSEVFNYDKWSPEIAYYFMRPDHGFKFSTCHYCDMAYINAYEVDVEKEAIFFLNTASDDELKSKLNTCSSNSINAYKAVRPYISRHDFDKVATSLRCGPQKFEKTFFPSRNMRRHFDIEHVLPKSVCPLVGLSLYNFVPSCQVCNSKLKQTRVLGPLGVPIGKLSPTSSSYDFDTMVKFRLVPKNGCSFSGFPTKEQDKYQLDLDTSMDCDYEYNVRLFKLRERYDYHKIEALHWLEMKYCYPDSRISMMANALRDSQFDTQKIKDDIFQLSIGTLRHRVFGKMKQDILK